MLDTIIKLIFCHTLGDYVLQTPFIAETKGSNWYHLFVHCVLYCLPFYLCFGVRWELAIIFAGHFITDAAKARYKTIGYARDQISHFILMATYLTR